MTRLRSLAVILFGALLTTLPAKVMGFSPEAAGLQPEVCFKDIAKQAGLDFTHVAGSKGKNYILETIGSGVAIFDYDGDGWQDIFFVNGTNGSRTDEGNRLFRNNGDGTFKDVTKEAGLEHHGWGFGVAVADYDNDGHPDLYVTYYGENLLYHNNGDGTFTDVTKRAGVGAASWSSGAAWGDYDRDGLVDLYVARYVDFDFSTVPKKGSSALCRYRSLSVMCGPRGLKGLPGILYHNNGDGTFTDVTAKALGNVPSYFGLTPIWGDFNNDGWPDLYVANDGTPSLLYRNKKDGTFEEIGVASGSAYSADGREQAGMGVDFADYNHDGWLDLFKTNFADDYDILYRNLGNGEFEDATAQARILNVSWKELGWATKFIDFDLDGWPDIFMTNGHVYPEVDGSSVDAGYKQHPQLLRNMGNGTFVDATGTVGPDILKLNSGRGAAIGDLANQGCMDIAVNNLDGEPNLFRCQVPPNQNWIVLRLIGTKSNRDALGARVNLKSRNLTQMQEVHQAGGFLSSNDTRLHFGLGPDDKVDQLEIRWPSGAVETFENIHAKQFVRFVEGQKNWQVDAPSKTRKSVQGDTHD